MPSFGGRRISCAEESQHSEFDATVGCEVEPAMRMASGRGKVCELCGSGAVFYCHADKAHLCADCDASVHSANFIVSWHVRTLLCFYCGCDTRWKSCGPSVRPERAVCHRCVQRSHANDAHMHDEQDEDRVRAFAATSSARSSSAHSENPDRGATVNKARAVGHRWSLCCGESENQLPSLAAPKPVEEKHRKRLLLASRALESNCAAAEGSLEKDTESASNCVPPLHLWAPSKIVVARQCGKNGIMRDSWLRLRQAVREEEGSCVTGGSSSSSGDGSEKARGGDGYNEAVSCDHARKKSRLEKRSSKFAVVRCVEGGRHEVAAERKLRVTRKRNSSLKGGSCALGGASDVVLTSGGGGKDGYNSGWS